MRLYPAEFIDYLVFLFPRTVIRYDVTKDGLSVLPMCLFTKRLVALGRGRLPFMVVVRYNNIDGLACGIMED